MKKKLFSLAFSIVAYFAINAQTYTYSTTVMEPDDAATSWTNYSNTATAGSFICDGLTFTPGGSAFGKTGSASTDFSDTDTSGNSITVNKSGYFAFGGACYSTSVTASAVTTAPTKRVLSVPIPSVPTGGKVIIKAFGNITATSTPNPRQLAFITISGTVKGYIDFSAVGPQVLKVELPDTFTDSSINLAALVGDIRVWRIEVITATSTLATINTKKSDANIFASGKTVYVKNLTSKNANINVYTLSGNLVKSFKTTSTSTQFELANGLYIVHVKSNEGEKSVKVSVKSNE